MFPSTCMLGYKVSASSLPAMKFERALSEDREVLTQSHAHVFLHALGVGVLCCRIFATYPPSLYHKRKPTYSTCDAGLPVY